MASDAFDVPMPSLQSRFGAEAGNSTWIYLEDWIERWVTETVKQMSTSCTTHGYDVKMFCNSFSHKVVGAETLNILKFKMDRFLISELIWDYTIGLDDGLKESGISHCLIEWWSKLGAGWPTPIPIFFTVGAFVPNPNMLHNG